MSGTLIGYTDWELDKDDEGYRDYSLSLLVRTSDPEDGPGTVLSTSGLPIVGSSWSLGNESDTWCRCRPGAKVRPVVRQETNVWWTVDLVFSNRPIRRCQDTPIDDPLAEPDRLSGSFVKYTEEAVFDRFGNLIENSSHEPIKGPIVEFDANRPSVVIEQNRTDLELGGFSLLIDSCNDATLWGLPARRVKLSNVSWERRYYGTCSTYWVRRLEFDVNYQGFDRITVDEGYMVLRGWWQPDGTWTTDPAADPDEPTHYVRYKDRHKENTKVLLDGAGNPLIKGVGTGTGLLDPVLIIIEKYPSANLLTLGIPATLA